MPVTLEKKTRGLEKRTEEEECRRPHESSDETGFSIQDGHTACRQKDVGDRTCRFNTTCLVLKFHKFWLYINYIAQKNQLKMT